ncbi:MAG TPA: VOC family protein [Steroidobacteraceae bacterium]
MEVVLGIGGLFFRARNPESLARWYLEHLGIASVPANYDDPIWQQEAGPTAFAPFEESTTYFGAGEKQWMVNFRVRNLEAMVAQLRSAAIAVEIDPQHYPNGRFARLHDPEGNPLELWEPRGRDAP